MKDLRWPVTFIIKKLSASKQKMSAIEKECWAIVWVIQKLSLYLCGKSFVLETDHQPLNYLHTAKQINPTLMIWAHLYSLTN